MSADWERVQQALRLIREAKRILRETGVLRSQRDLDVDLSEWYVAEATGGRRADSRAQAGWDVIAGDSRRIQVKKNNKSLDNPWRGTWYISDRELDAVGQDGSVWLLQMRDDHTIERAYEIPARDFQTEMVGERSGDGYFIRSRDLAESYQRNPGMFGCLDDSIN